MENKEKELLLKDLCARLPYGVKCKIEGVEEPKKLIRIEVDEVDGVLLDFESNIQVYLSEVKPYLRVLKSITEEQKKFLKDEYEFWYDESDNEICSRYRGAMGYSLVVQQEIIELNDFMLSNHFDGRGLIEMGIALPATEDMYNQK